MKKKRLTKKELENLIEECNDIQAQAEGAYIDEKDYQKEYKKRFGKEYEF